MKSRLAAIFAMAVGLLMISAPAFAHHGGSEYDSNHLITMKGTVTEFVWANPHCQIYVDVKDEAGKVVNWGIETLAPAVLKRAGWSPKTLHAGEQITVTIAPSKRGTPIGMIRKIVLANGEELKGGSISGEPPTRP
jgi:hypothetical protein